MFTQVCAATIRRIATLGAGVALGTLVSVASANALGVFQINDGTDFNLNGNFTPSGDVTSQGISGSGPVGGGTGTTIQMFGNFNDAVNTLAAGAGLYVAPPGTYAITFTYEGSEAGYQNQAVNFLFGNNTIFDNQSTSVGATSATFTMSSGLVPIGFQSLGNGNSVFEQAFNGGPISPTAAIGLLIIGNTEAYAFFEDIAQSGGDQDFDDMIVRIDLTNRQSSTPIPGAVFLFGSVLAGAAGVGGWRRKRKPVHATAAA